MARPPVQREELFDAADNLLAAGKEVTALALIDAVGGGSFRTIYKYLTEWEERRANAPKITATNTELPEAVKNAFLATWKVASTEAAREVTAAKEEAAKEVQSAQKQFSDALEAIQKMEADSEIHLAQIDTLKNRVAELEAALAASSNENSALKATAEELRERVRSQDVEIDHLHKDRDKERQLHQEQIDRMNADYARLDERANNLIEQLREQASALQKKNEQIENERSIQFTKAEQAAERLRAAEQSREQAHQERDAAMKEAAELKGQNTLLKEQNSELLQTKLTQSKPEK